MENETVKLSDFVKLNGIGFVYRQSDRNPHMQEFNGDHYRVTLRHSGKRMSLYFSKGFGHNGEPPTVQEVLDCIASDCAGYQNSGADFGEWCSEYGYGEDSRKAEKIFNTIMRQADRIKNLLGQSAYETLLWHTERL